MNRRFLALAATGVLLLAGLVPASGAVAEPVEATGCSHPKGYTVCGIAGGRDASIANELIRQLDRTGKGDTVRVAVFQWTLGGGVAAVADAVVKARQRGADVKAVVGSRGDNPRLNNAVIRKLKGAGIAVRQCKGACLPNPNGQRKGPMHNRFFLIERGGVPTVNVTSFSFTNFHLTQAHSLLGVHGDRGLYRFYTDYWNRLYSRDWDGWGESGKSVSGDRTQAWVFPRSTDVLAKELGRITGCGKGDKVWVSHANFQPNRPLARDQLGRIKKLGCDVKVVVLDKDSNNPSWIASATGSGSVRVHDDQRNKFIVAEAEFSGKHASIVWAGTHNLNGNGLKNADDNVMRVTDGAVADAYASYFQQLWKGA